MCAECQKINGHEPTCKYAVQAEQDAKTSKPTEKKAFMIFDVLDKTKKDGSPYIIIQAIDNEENSFKVYVWNRKWDAAIKAAKGATLLGELSYSQKGNARLAALEHVQEIAGVPYVNDAPAQQAQMPAQEPEEEF